MPDGDSDRASSLTVDRGLYVLRYVSSSSVDEFPHAKVRPTSDSRGAIEVVSAPGAKVGELREPGDSVVLVAQSRGAVEVSVRRRREGSTLDAVIQLERLGADAVAIVAPAIIDQQDSQIGPVRSSDVGWTPLTETSFSFLAHISRRGDVEVASGEWAAGPAAPSAIEGLQLIEPIGGRLPIEIQLRIPGPQGGWTPWAPAGVFAGTRGRALPIVGLRARLSGQSDGEFDLCGEALFLGAAAVSRRGSVIELFGPYETDPLVGLRLWFEARNFVPVPAKRADRGEVNNVRKSEVRPVRVFRSESGVRRLA